MGSGFKNHVEKLFLIYKSYIYLVNVWYFSHCSVSHQSDTVKRAPRRRTKDLRTCWQKFVILILQNIRTSLTKKNQQILICGVRLHFHKQFEQKSGFNMGNLLHYIINCIMYTTIVENAYLLAVNLVRFLANKCLLWRTNTIYSNFL